MSEYRRFAKPLDLTSATQSFRDRFWSKVDQRGPDECWEWTAYRKPSGYGQFTLTKGVFITASRVSLALTMPLMAGVVACHRCDNPPCVNPAHLFTGTQRDNTEDCISKGRGNRARGEDTYSSRLTEADVLAIRAEPERFGMYRELGRRYGVDGNTIRAVRNGTRWTHLDMTVNRSLACTKGHPVEALGLRREVCSICAEDYRISRLTASKRGAA